MQNCESQSDGAEASSWRSTAGQKKPCCCCLTSKNEACYRITWRQSILKRHHLVIFFFFLFLLEKCVMISSWIVESVSESLIKKIIKTILDHDHHERKIRGNHLNSNKTKVASVRLVGRVRRQVLPRRRDQEQVAPHVWENLITDNSSRHFNSVYSCQTSHTLEDGWSCLSC